MLMDKREHNLLLQKLLEELCGRGRSPTRPVRLMLVGSELCDPELVRFIEALGALVVADDHCTGSRYFCGEVLPGGDRLEAITARYIDRPRCPYKDLGRERLRPVHVLRLARDCQAAGVVFLNQKFCQPHQWDTPDIQGLLEKNGVRTLALEVTTANALGPLGVRLEAFIEMLALAVY